MKKITPTIRQMSPEETRANNLVNAGRVLEYEGTVIPLSAGRGDRIYVYTESTVIYVLNINHSFEYIGFAVYDVVSGEEYDSLFVCNSWELYEYLGILWDELPPETIVKTFRACFM